MGCAYRAPGLYAAADRQDVRGFQLGDWDLPYVGEYIPFELLHRFLSVYL
jgi:hypothetical protein